MQNNLFNVVLTGQLRDGVDAAAAQAALAALFKLSDEKVQQTLARAPLSVKSNIDQATAEKFKTALERAGFVCELQGVAAVAAPVALLFLAAARMCCFRSPVPALLQVFFHLSVHRSIKPESPPDILLFYSCWPPCFSLRSTHARTL